jgi:DNA-binding NtrC family response regulator
MPRSGRILVVDGDVNPRAVLADQLRGEGYEVETASDGTAALGAYEAFAPHVVITDLALPDLNGVDLMKQIRAKEDCAEVIVLAAHGAVATAVDAMRSGAADYLAKPVDIHELLVVLDKVFETSRLRRETRQLRARVRDRVPPDNMVGQAPAIQRVFEIVDQLASSRATVLITGESGTGKELIANALHYRSPRAHGPFVKLHCAALAESLLESELFGHDKGSFTGAMARKDGRFSLADGGTLFLDEIGDISPSIQVKLLRFLQEHEFERVGSTQTIKVDVRVIAATNRNLPEEVAKGRFREDLFYRLNVVSIEMPPLRDRRTDIIELARFFIERYAKQNDRAIEGLSPDAAALLLAYDWPGNVRELENAIERAVVLAPPGVIGPEHLPFTIHPGTKEPAGYPPIPGSTMAQLERYAIVETLKACGGSTSKASVMLGMSTRKIQYRLHEYRDAPHSNVDVVRITG